MTVGSGALSWTGAWGRNLLGSLRAVTGKYPCRAAAVAPAGEDSGGECDILTPVEDVVRQRGIPDESALIPFAPGFPPGVRWLVLAPHADDETLGPGGTLALAVARGIAVETVVLTDGAAQGDPELRHSEMLAAASVLGITPPRCLGFSDRSLAAAREGLDRTLAELLEQSAPETILVPSPVEVHPDHRAVALALQRVLRRCRGPLWVAAYEVGAALAPNLLVDLSGAWALKERAAECFASQLAVRPYGRVMAALAAFRALTLDSVEAAEGFHVLPARRVAALTPRGWAATMGSAAGVAGARDEVGRRWWAWARWRLRR